MAKHGCADKGWKAAPDKEANTTVTGRLPKTRGQIVLAFHL
jgi:hypothetical protein